MDRVEPKARELQRSSRFSLTRRQRAQPTEPMVSAGLPSPGSSSESRSSSESQQNYDEQASPAMRLKRSLSSLIRRSSSMMRRKKSPTLQSTPEAVANSGSIRQTRSEDSNRSCVFVSRSSSMSSDSTCGGLSTEEVSCALSLSHFHVSSANTMVSPLIGKSMVLVKVVMDANTAVVVSVIRSMVFARARERILTKLFQGGVPFVETKRRKLVLRRPEDGRIVAVVGDNPTWRNIMESVGHPYQWLREGSTAVNSPRAAEPCTDSEVVGQRVCAKSEIRTVPKLTLHLVDPSDVADMCSNAL
ncbi:hypothetical protein GGI15_003109 [Coemansia interrupta]|uniref:Uncharacterized protein n=1 Tax=Coemansia interrupta TaxID=1126814 RepID=A0A9W8LJQ5_9FUNG|nr:hypothetical protein GGI15_003109 [Coemansia interrupta]